MSQDLPTGVTSYLEAWGNGDWEASHRLFPLVYEELKRLARSRMRREREGHTLATTGLVHEAYLRLVAQHRGAWESRGHFFAIAAQMMRRVLVDYARQRQSKKRGGDAVHLPLEEVSASAPGPTREVLAVHEALEILQTIDRRKALMIELRFFGGLSIDETAECLAVSPGTVMRDWTLAKAWLQRELRIRKEEAEAGGSPESKAKVEDV